MKARPIPLSNRSHRGLRRLMAAVVLATIGALSTPSLADDAPIYGFVDIGDSVHAGDIAALAVAGITKGCNPPVNNRFCPHGILTRGEATAFLARGLEIPSAATDAFGDDDTSIFEADINAAAAAGIVKGCNPPDNDRFCPDRSITRAEFASLITRSLSLKSSSIDAFDDDNGSVHESDINAIAAAGITKGCNPPTNNLFCPYNKLTRAETASFLVRALGIDPVNAGSGEFPSPESTGARVGYEEMTASGSISTTYDGQVIDRMDVTGNIKILHDDVTVRDSRISFTSTYGLHVPERDDGSCPTGTLFEYVELDGSLAAENDIPVYSPGCEWTLDHAYVHDVGRSTRIVRNNTVSNSYIHSSRTGDSGAHRGGIGLNGGQHNVIFNNTLLCEGSGCSAALAMYGDTQAIDDILVQHNLMAATAAYCAYGGSVDSKPFPDATNVRFIDNHFSTRYFPDCGRAGPITSFDKAGEGNIWEGNIWHETGKTIP